VIANEPSARPLRPEEVQAGKDRREKSRRAKKAAAEAMKEKEPEAPKESDVAR